MRDFLVKWATKILEHYGYVKPCGWHIEDGHGAANEGVVLTDEQARKVVEAALDVNIQCINESITQIIDEGLLD